MNAQSNTADPGKGPLMLFQRLVNWFIPASLLHSQTNRGLARVFVQTHLLGAVAGALMLAHLSSVERAPEPGIYALGALVVVFLALPFVLRRTGNMSIVSLISFQVLGIVALIGTFQYGGFGSPFLPWLLVSLLSGLFYQSRRTGLVIGLFVADVAVFFAILAWHQQPALLPWLDWAYAQVKSKTGKAA